MTKKAVPPQNFLSKSLIIIGKPTFFLFKLLLLAFLNFSLLSNKVIHLLRRSRRHRRNKLTLTHRLASFPHPSLRTLFLFSSPFLGVIIFLAVFYLLVLQDLPKPTQLSHLTPSLSTKILSRDGTLLYKIYGNENRTLIPLSELPPSLIHATIAAEDQNFRRHHGLDLGGIARAARNNLLCRLNHSPCRLVLQGGSTITQQLVKNTLLTGEKTLRRKLREATLALLVEATYSKDQILELYLNNVPYGGTNYGVEAAAEELFGKSARDLTLAESALLAGLPVAPTTLSPFGTTPYLAKARQHQVLERMVEEGYITENDKVAAEVEGIDFHPKGDTMQAPHFVMYVKSLLVQSFGESMVERGGLVVTTTLDLAKQRLLESAIDQELNKLQKLNVQNGAGLIISPTTGEILSMVGSRNFWDISSDGQVNVTLMPRQPGSSIKPLTYSLALLSGLSPSSLIDDSPVCFTSPGSPPYCPTNYDGRFHGQVTLRTALASSYNVPAVRLLNSLGLNNLIDLGQKLGITTWNDRSRFGLSLTLGGGEVTMYDLASAYSVFASGGLKVPLTPFLSIADSQGHPLALVCPSCVPNTAQASDSRRVLPEEVAYQISSMLADPVARAPAFGTHSVLTLKGSTVPVKTGTTNNLRDNWTFGYTNNILVATWVGNNDNSPMSKVASGITGASPIWASVMQELLKDSPPYRPTPPASMIQVALCPSTRTAYCPSLCPTPPVYEYFPKTRAPRLDCQPTGSIE